MQPLHYQFNSPHDGTLMRIPVANETWDIIDDNPGGEYGIAVDGNDHVPVEASITLVDGDFDVTIDTDLLTAAIMRPRLTSQEQARLMTVYERLRPEALEIFARLSQYAVEYSIVIDPATVTFSALYATLWGVIPADDYERLRVLYENEVVAYEYEGNGRAARADFPGLLYLAQQELTQL